MDVVAELQELENQFAHLQAARYHIVAPVVVLYFDWFLTFSLEFDRFWKPKPTGPTVLFFINRYFPIIGFIPTMIAYFSDTWSHEHVVPFVVTANVISQSIIAMILALRTYALYHQSRAVLILVSLAWVALTTIGAWGGSFLVRLELPPGIPGCILHIPDESKFRLAAAYIGSLSFDALIYGLTLWRTYRLRRTRSRLRLSGDTLLDLVFRDGSIYFIVLLGANLLTILLICLAEPDLRIINVTFTHIIPVTITSRLLLNLRRDVRKAHATSISGVSLSTVGSEFLTVVLGNLGDVFMDGTEDTFTDSDRSTRSKPWDDGDYDSRINPGGTVLDSIELTEIRLGANEVESERGWDPVG